MVILNAVKFMVKTRLHTGGMIKEEEWSSLSYIPLELNTQWIIHNATSSCFAFEVFSYF